MKVTRISTARPKSSLILSKGIRAMLPVLGLMLASAESATAADYYWDTNGTTAGSGTTAGNWDGGATNWTLDPTGVAATEAWVDGNNAIFSAGTTAGTWTTTITGTIQTPLIRMEEVAAQALTITGGSINIGGGMFDSSALGGATGRSVIVDSLLTGTGGLTLQVNGDVSDSGSGSNSLFRLGGANTFTGDVTIKSGIVAFNAGGSAFGAAANKIILDGGGLLDANENRTLSRDIIVSGGGGYLRTYGSTNFTLTGDISTDINFSTTTLRHTDSGILTLAGTGANYVGSIVNGAGTLNISAANANWSQTDFNLLSTGGVMNFNGSGTSRALSIVTTSKDVNVNNGAVLNLGSGGYTWSTASGGSYLRTTTTQATGSVTSSTGTLTFTNGSSSVGSLETDDNRVQVYIKDFDASTAVAVVKKNVNELTLDQSNTYTGGTTIEAGRVNFSNLKSAGTGTVTVNSGGQAFLSQVGTYANNFVLAGVGVTEAAGNVGALRFVNSTVSGNVTIAAAGARIVGYSGSTGTITGNLLGSGALEINAPTALFNGTISLTGAGSGYSGTVTVAQGRFNLGASLGGSIVVADGATLGGEPAITGDLTLGSVTGTNFFFNGATAGSLGVGGTLTKNGVTTLNFSKFPAASGTVTALTYTTGAGAGTFALANAASFRNSTVTDTGTSVTVGFDNKSLTWAGPAGGNWDVNTAANWTDGATQTFFYGDNVTFTNTGAGTVVLAAGLQPGSVTVNSTTNYTFTTGSISGGTGITKLGTSLLALNTANTFTGDVSIQAGTLQTGNGSALGTIDGTTTIASGATLDINAQSLGSERIFVQGTGVGGAGAIINSSATAQQQAFRFITLTGDATIGGTGRWDLRGATLSGGGGETFDLAGFTLTKTGTNLIYAAVNGTVTSGNIVVNQGTLGLWQSTVTGSGTITVNAAGTLEVNPVRASEFTRAIALNGGTLTAGGATFIDSAVTVTANSTVNLANALTLNNTVSESGGSFGLVKNGAAALSFAGAATFTGPLTVNAGSVTVTGSAGVLNGPKVNLVGAATVTVDNSTTFIANRLGTASSFTISNGSILAFNGNATSNSSHTAGALNGGTGFGALTLSTQPASSLGVNFTSYVPSTTGMLLVRAASGLGAAPGAGSGNVTFTAAPATEGAGVNSGNTRPIVPGILAINGAGANLGTFVAYDSTNGLVPLNRDGIDYAQTTNFAGIAADQNVFINGTATAPAGTTAMNSLFINIQDVAGAAAGSTLRVNSGQVLISDTSAGKSYTFGTNIATAPLTLDFNGKTAFITLSSSTNFQPSAGNQNTGNREYVVNAKIDNTGSGGLVVSGVFGTVMGLHNRTNTQGATTIQGLNGVLAPSATPFTVNFDHTGVLGAAGAGVTLNNARLQARLSVPEVAEQGVAVSVNRPLSLVDNLTSTGVVNGLGADFSDELAWSGAITGTASLTKIGAGRLVIAGAATYAGTTIVNGGVLQIGAGGTAGALPATAITLTPSLNVGANLVYARSDQANVTSVVSGAGSVVVLSGTMNFGSGGAAQGYSGDTVVYGGNLRLVGGSFNNGSGVGSSKVYIYPGATLTTTATHHFGNNASGTTPIAILGGTLTTANAEFYFGNLEMWGGTFTGLNESRAGGSRSLMFYPSSTGSTFDRNFALNAVGSNTGTFYVNDGTAANDLTVSKSITSGTNVVKAGTGTMRLTAASGYTGATTLQAGVFKLDFANATPTTNLLAATGTPTFAGGNLTVAGKDNTANTQTLGVPTLNAGGSSITLSPGAGTGTVTLTLGSAWVRNTGATLNVSLTTGATLTSAPTLTNNVLGYATVNGTDFATVTAGAIAAFGGYDPDDFSAATKNTSVTTATSAPGVTFSVNSLRLSNTGGTAVTLAAGTSTVGTGGVLIPSTVTAVSTISGGSLTGSASDLIIHQFSPADVTLGAVVPANGTSGLTKAGTGKLILSATNLYTGATQINGGTLEFSAVGNLGAAAAPVTFGGGTLRWGGGATTDITAGRTVTIGPGGGTLDVPTGTVTLGAIFGGSGTLTKTGAGTLSLTAANTLTGTVVVDAGVLNIANLTGLGANQTQAIIVNTGGTLNLNSNSFSSGHLVAVQRSLFINGGLVQNNANQTMRLGNVFLSGGTLNTQQGSLNYDSFYLGTLKGTDLATGTSGANATVFVTGTAPSFITTSGVATNNGLRLGPNVVFNVSDVTGTTDVDLSVSTVVGNQVTDFAFAPGAFTKRGTGTMLLTGSNTYTGGTTLSQGTLQLRNANALGTAGLVYVGDAMTGSGNLSLLIETNAGNSYNVGRSIHVSNYGTGTVTLGSIQTGVVSGVPIATFSGPISIQRNVILQSGANDNTTFSGAISGTGNFTVTGGKRVTFSNARNSFVGDIGITGASTIFQTNTAGTLPSTTGVSVAVGTRFILAFATAQSIDRLTGSGIVSARVGSPTLTVGAAGGTSIFDGVFNATGDGVATDGALVALVKAGTGAFELTGNSSVASLTVNSGLMTVNGTLSGATTVSGGTLEGFGSVGAVTLTSGTLTAGDGTIDSLSTGSLNLNGGTAFFEMNPVGVSDQFLTTGTITFGGQVQLALSFASDLTEGTPFTLIDNDGTVDSIDFTSGNGFYLGANPIVPGVSFDYTSGAFTESFVLSTTGGDGNNLTLTVVPEPGVALALLSGMGVLFARRRRRTI